MDYFHKTFWESKNVLLTGHTGFKGAWFFHLLKKLKVNVAGYSLAPVTDPSLFQGLEYSNNSYVGDIRDIKLLTEVIQNNKPEIVFHLAAQPLVLSGYQNPIETYETNINGTINLLEALKKTSSIKAIIIITSDKVYKNNEWKYGYRENDALGGHDPYSASKACVEIISNSYMNSFFQSKDVYLTTARAGNVIGGGDWSDYRLIPDIVRSIYENKDLFIRYPKATRPWQHVVEPLFGYLELARKTYLKEIENGESFNFGPTIDDERTVEQIIKKFLEINKNPNINISMDKNEQFHEASSLSLSIDKSINLLNWKPIFNTEEAINMTVNWYQNYYNGISNSTLLDKDISDYLSKLKN